MGENWNNVVVDQAWGIHFLKGVVVNECYQSNVLFFLFESFL